MKLSTLETVEELKPIEGADAIELAVISGWECVVKKGEFEVGDVCIYVPPDTLVDTDREHFNFLSKSGKSNLVRVKPSKIRGVWSEGLLLRIDFLPKDIGDIANSDEGKEFDFGELLGVTKYNKEVVLVQKQGVPGQKNYTFPFHIISKTDEDSLKNNKKILQELVDKDIYISKKMDGSSMTLILKDDEFTVCSRNMVLDVGSVMYQYVIREGLEDKLRNLTSGNIAIQGEFVGPKVNGNKLKLKDYDFYVFNIKNLNDDKYHDLCCLREICFRLELKLVPILFAGPYDLSFDMNYFKEMANSIKYDENVHGEGIIIRPTTPFYSNYLRKNFSCKVINQNYKD